MPKQVERPETRTPVHIRIDSALVRRLDHLGVDINKDRGETIQYVLAVGLAALDKQPAAAS